MWRNVLVCRVRTWSRPLLLTPWTTLAMWSVALLKWWTILVEAWNYRHGLPRSPSWHLMSNPAAPAPLVIALKSSATIWLPLLGRRSLDYVLSRLGKLRVLRHFRTRWKVRS